MHIPLVLLRGSLALSSFVVCNFYVIHGTSRVGRDVGRNEAAIYKGDRKYAPRSRRRIASSGRVVRIEELRHSLAAIDGDRLGTYSRSAMESAASGSGGGVQGASASRSKSSTTASRLEGGAGPKQLAKMSNLNNACGRQEIHANGADDDFCGEFAEIWTSEKPISERLEPSSWPPLVQPNEVKIFKPQVFVQG